MRTAWARSHAAAARDVLLVACLAGSLQYEVWVGPLFQELSGPRLADATVLALVCVPLLWRRTQPITSFAIVVVAAALQVKIEYQTWLVPSYEGTMQGWFATLIAFYSVSAHAGPRRAMAAGLVGGATLVANDLLQLLTATTTLNDTFPAWFIVGGAWGLGYALRGRQVQVHELADRAARLEHEQQAQARAAVAAERSRIARELHDVVAHSLSVIVIQAQAAYRVLDGDQPSAREALGSIDATGRQALVEMRRLVGMLREDAELSLMPQPGLGQLDALLAQMRDAGLRVELAVEGQPRSLTPGLDLTAYRIVQEALTNTLKHAGPATARVVLRFEAEDMELEVVDDGHGARDANSSGHGLVGMRERVAVYGGELESGTCNGRGFRVRARLPT